MVPQDHISLLETMNSMTKLVIIPLTSTKQDYPKPLIKLELWRFFFVMNGNLYAIEVEHEFQYIQMMIRNIWWLFSPVIETASDLQNEFGNVNLKNGNFIKWFVTCKFMYLYFTHIKIFYLLYNNSSCIISQKITYMKKYSIFFFKFNGHKTTSIPMISRQSFIFCGFFSHIVNIVLSKLLNQIE